MAHFLVVCGLCHFCSKPAVVILEGEPSLKVRNLPDTASFHLQVGVDVQFPRLRIFDISSSKIREKKYFSGLFNQIT